MKSSRYVFMCAFVVTLAACDGGSSSTHGPQGGTGGMLVGGAGGTAGEDGSGASTTASTTSAGGTGGESTGGTGGAGVDCSKPLTPWAQDGTYSNPIGPLNDELGGWFAQRLGMKFAVGTTCTTLIVGLASSNPAVCQIPSIINVAAWSDSGEIVPPDWGELPITTPSFTPYTVALATSETPFNGAPDAHVYRFTGSWSFAAGEPAFVGVQLQEQLCVVGVLPNCDPTEGLRYRPNEPGSGWAFLAHALDSAPPTVPDVSEQLILGVEDCAPTEGM